MWIGLGIEAISLFFIPKGYMHTAIFYFGLGIWLSMAILFIFSILKHHHKRSVKDKWKIMILN